MGCSSELASGNVVKFCGVRVLHNKRYLKHPFSDSHKIEGGGSKIPLLGLVDDFNVSLQRF